MATFTDLVAGRIGHRREEFLAGLSPEPLGSLEATLAAGVRALWHRLPEEDADGREALPAGPAAAVDGSRSVRALSSGAD
jgi:hypothetical protein